MDQPLPATYRRTALSTVLVLVGCCLGLNLAVDPLWHFSGNRLSGLNLGFNERLSKLNRAARVAAGRDCVIYGSSRATLLDPSLLSDWNCYNMAVSEGLSGEFPVYADYLQRQGLKAQTVIIGVDDLSLFAGDGRANLPAWLREGGQRPRWWQDYLSLDALEFSIRALAGNSPRPRYYQADFSIAIEADARRYRPDPAALVPWGQGSDTPSRTPYAGFLREYQALLAAHEGARILLYVPPISPWRVSDMIRRGELMTYLEGIHSLSQLGLPLLDFSVPGPLNADTRLSYDGSHYDLSVNARIAAALQSLDCGPCLRVDGLSLTAYRQRFEAAYRQQRARLMEAAATPPDAGAAIRR